MALSFATTTLEARGHDELEMRLTREFNWEMVRSTTGEVAAAGLEVLILDADGFIETDYQFIES
jgi:hypothetical protein